MHYKDVKKRVVALMDTKSDQFGFQRQIVGSLARYEERNQAFLSERPEMTAKVLQKMVLGGQSNALMKDFQKTSDMLLNPFSSMFYWVKG